MIFLYGTLVILGSLTLGCLLERFAPNVAARLFPEPDYTRTPDAIEQIDLADKAKARRVEAERAARQRAYLGRDGAA